MSKLVIAINSTILFTVVSCGNAGQENAFIQNNDPNQSKTTDITNIENSNTGIDLFDINPGMVCLGGGINILTFVDTNDDYCYQIEETLLKSKSICHGTNGTNGTNGTSSSTELETIPAGLQCPNGGVKISSNTSSAVYVCHGQNGAQGLQGLQGLQGQAGTSGTQVLPIKFCSTDNSAYPEYGLQIGNELFGVFWGTSPASPSVPQAYLAKIIPGQYMSTGGNGCIFTVP